MTKAMRSALARLEAGGIDARQFLALWRNEAPPLLAELPPRFGGLLDALLMRLEAAASFAGERCSFSHQALLEELAHWLDRAEARLAACRKS